MNPKTVRVGRVLVVGIGNPDRGDDGIGSLVAGAVERRAPPYVDVRRRSGDILGLIEDWRDYASVILVDAAAGESPGRIHRIDLRAEALPRTLSQTSSHGFGIAEAVALAASLRQLPPRLILYAIEAEGFDGPIGDRVGAAAESATARILGEL